MEIDAEVAALACRQGGVVARRQLRAVGVSERAIDHRVRSGRLRRIEHGVYAVGGAVLARGGVVWAAVLSCGPAAVAGFRDAAWGWELCPPGQGRVHVCVPGDGGGRRRTIRLHRGGGLRPQDCTTVGGMPVTSVARTLLDEAGRTTPGRLLKLLAEAEHRELYDHRAVLEVLAANPRHMGARRLAAAGARPALRLRSILEGELAAALRLGGLDGFDTNAIVCGFEVDVVFRRERVVVEADTVATHRARFQADRERDRALAAAGFLVLRVTDADVELRPARAVAEIAAVVERQRAMIRENSTP